MVAVMWLFWAEWVLSRWLHKHCSNCKCHHCMMAYANKYSSKALYACQSYAKAQQPPVVNIPISMKGSPWLHQKISSEVYTWQMFSLSFFIDAKNTNETLVFLSFVSNWQYSVDYAVIYAACYMHAFRWSPFSLNHETVTAIITKSMWRSCMSMFT